MYWGGEKGKEKVGYNKGLVSGNFVFGEGFFFFLGRRL